MVDGLHAVVRIAAVACVAAGALGFATMPSRRRAEPGEGDRAERRQPTFHCPLDAPPSVVHAGHRAAGR